MDVFTGFPYSYTTAHLFKGVSAFIALLYAQLRSCFSGTRYKEMVPGCNCSQFEQKRLKTRGNRYLTESQTQPLYACRLLQSLQHLCDPSLDSIQCVHVSLVLGSPALGPALSPVLSTGKGSSLLTCRQHFSKYSPGYHWPSFHSAGSLSNWVPKGQKSWKT